MKNASNNIIIENKKSNYFFSVFVSSCCCLCVLLHSKLEIIIKLIQTQIQILRNRMQEQSFCFLYCNMFLLQNLFQILNSCNKFSTKHNYKNNLKCCYNFINYNFINNAILDYLSMLQSGTKIGNDEYG
jgi:hypothetical protein